MKRTTSRAALAAIALTGFVPVASAVPIRIDFTGTLLPGSSESGLGVANGDPVSGGFTLETDQLVYGGLHGTSRSWSGTQPAGSAEPLAFLSFGSRQLEFGTDTDAGFGLNFSDDCTPSSCSTGPDSFSLFVGSGLSLDAGFTGIANTYSFYIASMALTHQSGDPYFDYFDGAQVDPLSIVSLPLHDTFGTYFEDTLSCVEGRCESLGGVSIGFAIDTVTRGVGARAVPEPGTLSLMMFALAGMLLVRRRAPAH